MGTCCGLHAKFILFVSLALFSRKTKMLQIWPRSMSKFIQWHKNWKLHQSVVYTLGSSSRTSSACISAEHCRMILHRPWKVHFGGVSHSFQFGRGYLQDTAGHQVCGIPWDTMGSICLKHFNFSSNVCYTKDLEKPNHTNTKGHQTATIFCKKSGQPDHKRDMAKRRCIWQTQCYNMPSGQNN